MIKNLFETIKQKDPDAQLIQTHISSIILTNDFAYKLKKPVDFGFLDYSTLERRRFFSKEEIRLNQRTAPGLYLSVVPIGGSPEKPILEGREPTIEYAVKMRRFKQEEQLDNIILTAELIDELAALIASFHQKAQKASGKSDYGTSKKLIIPIRENFDLLESANFDEALKKEIQTLKATTEKNYQNIMPLLQERKEKEFIRECHGDMHLRNIALFQDKLILFDGIEFNPYLLWIDVISDLAFLLMDLEYLGMEHYANRLLNLYLEITGDYKGLGVLQFYKSYRAMVRSKVAYLTAMQTEEKEPVIQEMKNYIALAKKYNTTGKSFLAITYGLSGSGKSTFCKMASKYLNAIYLRSDRERMRLFNKKTTNIYTQEITQTTYSHLAKLSKRLISYNYNVIIDATFLIKWQRDIFMLLAQELHIPFYIFSMECDIELMRQRIAKRQKENKDISEADLKILDMQLQSLEPLNEAEKEKTIFVDMTTIESMTNVAVNIKIQITREGF